MSPGIFNLLLSGWLFFIYSAICILSIIFTFFLELYIRIEEKLIFHIFSDRILTPLDRSIDWFNLWLMKHNRIAGALLIMLSLIDLKLSFDSINKL
ncbi:MAG: hypothetical protein Q8R31_03955 [Candidatus Omnitrophota bacterium]|nr:hypothetical protein [Candidatus Omnitrophota bacterium]